MSRPYPDGPPIRHSGGFGEPTCRACHAGGPDPGTPGGQAEIRGLPAAFERGRSYDITVVVTREGLERAGFQLATRFAPGTTDEALQAGTLTLLDPARSGLDRDSTLARTVYYAHHTRAGTRVPTTGENRWALRWTAPDRPEAVAFHLAVVVSNDDNSNLGDEVVARAQIVPPAVR